jgi:hypothetical protein
MLVRENYKPVYVCTCELLLELPSSLGTWGLDKATSRRLCSAVICTALHCNALHCTSLHSTALHNTTLHCTTLHSSHRNGLYSTVENRQRQSFSRPLRKYTFLSTFTHIGISDCLWVGWLEITFILCAKITRVVGGDSKAMQIYGHKHRQRLNASRTIKYFS